MELRTFMQKQNLVLWLLVILLGSTSPAWAFKIGVVDLNRALNESETGIRSRNVLEARGRQKQKEFQAEEEELRELAEKLRNNPLLTKSARQQKEQELQQRQQQLQEQARQFEQELRGQERQLTEGIFSELKGSIRTVSIREQFDLVLERNAAQVILYMKEDTTDLTQKVIDHYNALKASE
ncbi:MAG: hypothetical protein CL923_08750 [Deltaproteobacteria bacterium]|jgi:outer membrane protein|nr:hypothetical protein [Deltaproteobacteria bacterium]